MENINSIIYQAAIYLRLSREDGDVAEGSKLVSNSISNQKSPGKSAGYCPHCGPHLCCDQE